MSVSAQFNETFYLTNNADVVVGISQGHFSSALQHYTLFGGKELRAPNSTFDPNYYAINNGDVLNAVSAGTFFLASSRITKLLVKVKPGAIFSFRRI